MQIYVEIDNFFIFKHRYILDSIILKYFCETQKNKSARVLAVVVYHMGKSFKILMFSSNIERKTISILQTKCKNFARVAM